jgi:hypothetical protein
VEILVRSVEQDSSLGGRPFLGAPQQSFVQRDRGVRGCIKAFGVYIRTGLWSLALPKRKGPALDSRRSG